MARTCAINPLIVPFDQYNGPILYFKKYIKAVSASSSCEK